MSGKKIIFITYAWKDNEENDFDFLVQELEAKGLEVRFDRVRLQAGKRLWEQIDANIADPELDGWAILLSKNSLLSEPCLEELAYALDRTLRTKGSSFPLIGIFSEEIERELIPSAIATRLFVKLTDSDWADQICNAFLPQKSVRQELAHKPFGLRGQRSSRNTYLEFWPRVGNWSPILAGVRSADFEMLGPLMNGPKGYVTGSGMYQRSEFEQKGFKFTVNLGSINSTQTAHLFLNKVPELLVFGGAREGNYEYFQITADEINGLIAKGV